MGRGRSNTASFVDVKGSFLTNSKDIANHFSNFFTDKINNLRTDTEIIVTMAHQQKL